MGCQVRLYDPKTYRRLSFDRDIRSILGLTYEKAKSANQIIVESNVAPSTAYRKLKKLVTLNFLQVEYVIGNHGRWETRYKKNLCLADERARSDCI